MSVKVGLKFIEKWGSNLEQEIQNYEAEEVEKGQIVFYGPSNFTRWSTRFKHKPLREVLLGKSGKPCCINRGFGSSCSEQQLYYYPRAVRPLEPKVLVYCTGLGNGLGFGYTPEELFELAQRVVVYAKTDFPDLRIYLICSSNWRKKSEKVAMFNNWMAEFAATIPDCKCFDPTDYTPLHREDIYVEDNVHYNQQGYDLYAEYFKEILKDELAEF